MHGPTSLFHPIRYTIICAIRLVEGRWTLGGEDSGTGSLGDAVWKWELEVLGEELLDVWALDVLGLLELDNLENLCYGLEPVLMIFGNWGIVRGWNGSGSGGEQPCPGREPRQRRCGTSHGTPCTCCGFRNENRNGSRYRSS